MHSAIKARRILIRSLNVLAGSPVKTANSAKRSRRSNKALDIRLNKKTKKRLTRWGIIAANFAVVGIIGVIALSTNNSSPSTVKAAQSQSLIADHSAKPLDSLSSVDVAVNVARMTGLQEATAVVNKADDVKIQLAVATPDDAVVAKPQIVGAGLKSRKDIKDYTVVQGDTVQSVADKFGVSAETIRISNNIDGDALEAGKAIVVSPINGLVYTVQAGDTPDSLASKYRADKNNLLIFNDAESTGAFKVGERIVIPGGIQPVPVFNYAAAQTNYSTGYGYGFAFGSSPIYGNNGYVWGYCTWGVASIIQVPNNWGNASSWAFAARLSGWNVSTVPTVGSIAQRAGGAGHVGIVTDVSPDGSMIKYKDMNGLAGFGRWGQSDWVPGNGGFQYFISH